MKKAAIILANGFEEIEALTVVDVLRRADISCTVLGFDKQVTGSHGVVVLADEVLDADASSYDMLILPGGMPGSTNLKSNETVISMIKKMQSEDKYIAAICAAPIVLDQAGVLKGKDYTCYDGFENEIKDGNYVKKAVVTDGKLTTACGPALALDFAYELVRQLGKDPEPIIKGMLYGRK